jgi:hypothetical protein
MTTLKDTIRQASLYTMNGLIDPRMMPGYETPSNKHQSKNIFSSLFRVQLIWRKLSLR